GHTLTPAFVRNPGYRGFRHGRMTLERDLDLTRVHVQAARDDHLLRPAADHQVPGGRVYCADVAGAEPAVRGEGSLAAGRVVPVAGENVRSAELDLAVGTGIGEAARWAVPGADAHEHAGQRHSDRVPARVGDRIGDVQPA